MLFFFFFTKNPNLKKNFTKNPKLKKQGGGAGWAGEGARVGIFFSKNPNLKKEQIIKLFFVLGVCVCVWGGC